MLIGVGVLCLISYSIVSYLYVSFSELVTSVGGERGGLVVNASDSGSRGRGFESHSGQTVLCP